MILGIFHSFPIYLELTLFLQKTSFLVFQTFRELLNSKKGKVKEQWGKLTDDDLDVIAGKRDQLLGRIQERHGMAKDEAEKQVRDWESRNPDVTLGRY